MSNSSTSPRPGISGPGDVGVDDRAADPDADPYSVARSIALKQLTMAPKSRAQLREAMARRNVSGDVADAVLDRLEQVKLVDDAAFAEGWVRSRQQGRGLARRALAHELRAKGVDDDTARAALDEIDPDDEAAAARRLVDRKVAATRGLDRQVRVRRLAGMLARKGYPSGLSMQVVREALDDDGG
ncbi:MAG TPA: regulatory protein RecX [Actinomycetales bacterium]|nr:regulatory protein RecX [Actinomycetales bacterium]